MANLFLFAFLLFAFFYDNVIAIRCIHQLKNTFLGKQSELSHDRQY